MKNDPLLQPYRLKHLTLKNRIIMPAHEPAYAEDGLPKDRYRAYHVERAKGGIAMTMTAGSAVVSKDSPPTFGNILAYKDEVVPWLRKLADECHEYDCAVMIQLTHLGRRSHWELGDWLPLVSASGKREAAHRGFPKQAEQWDIDRIISDYADAAERMKAAGLDGFEVHGYCHIIDQFWSDVTNQREDNYGGSFENRMRFSDQLLSAIRDRVGDEFIVGIRYTADEQYKHGGIDAEEGLKISRHLRDSGKVDFLNIIRGRCDTDPAMVNVIPVTGMKSSPHLDFAGHIKAEIGMPVMHAAKIADIATARHAISSGKLDLVGMVRSHIADPHLVQKLIEGREEDIRPCVGATYCLDRIYLGFEALCTHNAATGRELDMPHVILPSKERKKVVIVGAGPGGLEAARVAAERGHEVIVFEATNQPGGQVLLLSQSLRRREMNLIVEWRVQQCSNKGVEFRYDTFAEATDVTNENPDVVIIATGGLPNTEILATGNNLVESTWDIISRSVKPGTNVLLFDDAGDHAGLQAAEIIAAAGSHVEIMTPDRNLAPDVMNVNLTPYMRELQDKDVKFTIAQRLVDVVRDDGQLKAIISSDYREDLRIERDYDQVVVNHGTIPMEELYFDLIPQASNSGEVDYEALTTGKPQNIANNKDGKFQLYRIGDAVSSRNIHAAVYDALRFCKDI